MVGSVEAAAYLLGPVWEEDHQQHVYGSQGEPCSAEKGDFPLDLPGVVEIPEGKEEDSELKEGKYPLRVGVGQNG